MSRWVLLLGLMMPPAVACDSETGAPGVTLSDPEGAFSFQVDTEPVDERGGGDKVLWDLGTIRFTAQREPTTAHNRDLSLTQVGEALTRRLELEGHEGSLTTSSCTVSGRPSACLTGEIQIDGEVVHRRGILFEDGEDLVLVEVLGAGDEVGPAFTQLKETLSWTDA